MQAPALCFQQVQHERLHSYMMRSLHLLASARASAFDLKTYQQQLFGGDCKSQHTLERDEKQMAPSCAHKRRMQSMWSEVQVHQGQLYDKSQWAAKSR